MTKSRMKFARHVTHKVDMGNEHKILVGKPERENSV
jgi:hypothetical protein